jgi:peptide/nickel transport system permease protein
LTASISLRGPAGIPARSIWRSATVIIGMSVMGTLLFASIVVPFIYTVDPNQLIPTHRLRPPSAEYWFGTDAFGRDVLARVLHGGRISLLMGALVAILAVSIGTLIGIVSGYFRALDQVLMRIMDGLMVIPGILLAIALVAISGASLTTIVFAITLPEIPRVARLVRSIVLGLREEAYVEAAIGLGTPLPKILWRHILPNTIGPLIVQGTYVAAAAVITEAALSFLGAGLSTQIPTWGNIIAEGRMFFRISPWIIAFPGLFLALMVLAINLLGDGLRDILDPKSSMGALR